MEHKSISLEVKDLDKGKRTIDIAHAVYTNIDRTEDISRKGMFTKSWNESKDEIALYLNHDDTLSPGLVLDVYEDEEKAYTRGKFGTHTLGNDTMIMVDEGIIKKASFGYAVMKKNYIQVKGKKVRELLEVKHFETSLLTKMPANPLAGVVSLQKSFEVKTLTDSEAAFLKRLAANTQNTLEELVAFSATIQPTSDLYTWINYHISRQADMIGDYRSQLKWNSQELKELKQHIEVMERFCRNTKASDECIKSIAEQIEEAKSILSEVDTVDTQLIIEPSASKKELVDTLKSINNLFKETK